jgi:hypothetical protein
LSKFVVEASTPSGFEKTLTVVEKIEVPSYNEGPIPYAYHGLSSKDDVLFINMRDLPEETDRLVIKVIDE